MGFIISTSTLADPNPNPSVVISAWYEIKGYVSCALIITMSDFRGPPK